MANKPIPVNQFNISGGSSGAVGHLECTTSQDILRQVKIDLIELVAEAPSDTEIFINVTAPDGKKIRIFGGEHVATDFDMDAGIVHIVGRDYAGRLVDQHKVLTSVARDVTASLAPLTPGQSAKGVDVPTQNTKISKIVSSIATAYGFTPIINMGDDHTYGSILGSDDTTFMPVPMSVWEILNHLARETGNEVYTTPNKELVFGVPGAGLPHQDISYNLSPNQPPASATQVPGRALNIKHNPRRNASFRVIVFSYYVSSKKTSIGRATVISPNLGGRGKLKEGLYTGAEATAVDKQVSNLQHSTSSQGITIPLYSYHMDGLTPEQANAKAKAIAIDISKRELILNVQTDMLPNLRPTQIIKLMGAVLPGMLGPDYYVNQFTHTFNLGGERGDDAGGLLTHIHALNVPFGTLGGSTGSGGLGGGRGS